MDKLFNMFGKLLRTADMNHEGIGMGLLICKNLVKLSGGTIDVHSDGLDKGSVFSFSVKVQETRPAKKESQPQVSGGY